MVYYPVNGIIKEQNGSGLSTANRTGARKLKKKRNPRCLLGVTAKKILLARNKMRTCESDHAGLCQTREVCNSQMHTGELR